ncbi:hypothetical protein LUZ60_004308 [Juncus effusus]|nr:hypothetical protein LUZ60_004308 [Juncus effusus]
MVEAREAMLVFVVLNIVSLHLADALRFELKSSRTKCISEEMKINDMSVGKYKVINDQSSVSDRVTVRVSSPYNNNARYAQYVHYSENVESGNFAFTALENGNYITCFWSPDQSPGVETTVEFEWKTGVSARDWTSVAKKGQIDVMGLELKKMEDTVKSIHDEMLYLREREQDMQNMNRKISDRIFWLSLLSLVIILSVVGLQWWHLKNFFERKKIL